MEKTQKAMRLHIGIFGAVNSGKSSFLNLICNQNVSIISEEKGTTTDVVEKAQELMPFGPILWLDTAGYGDDTKLSAKRLEKTYQTIDRIDVAVVVSAGKEYEKQDENIIRELNQRKIPIIRIFNKKDIFQYDENGAIVMSATDFAQRERIIEQFKEKLIEICPEDFINPPTIFGDLVPENGLVVLLIPIDQEAPKGRLILPQVQTIRDGLDNNQIMIITKENRYKETLQTLNKKPDLVICDSQLVDFMVENTPADIKCTTFSILFGRLKGDLNKFVEGAERISKLRNNDKVLIAESCTHHAVEDDIGRVKIPNWLRKKTTKDLQIDYTSGCGFPKNLSEYKLVIQCGGCMINRREILSRINQCSQAGVPITNYGICISELKGVLQRVIEPFKMDK